MSVGNSKDAHIYELVNDCRITVEPMFAPPVKLKSGQKGFLVYGQVPQYFGKATLQAKTLGEFCDRWGDHLKKINGTETCGYKPSYPNPRTMLLNDFLEAEKNNEVMWHE